LKAKQCDYLASTILTHKGTLVT